MKTISEIKREREVRTSAAIKANGVFFAFSNEQFEEGKTPLKEGEKYVSIGMGGYMPKGNIAQWRKDLDEIDAWFKAKTAPEKIRRDYIAYELNNHEAYYTGDIEDTVEALGEDYTNEEVWKVFQEEYASQMERV